MTQDMLEYVSLLIIHSSHGKLHAKVAYEAIYRDYGIVP